MEYLKLSIRVAVVSSSELNVLKFKYNGCDTRHAMAQQKFVSKSIKYSHGLLLFQ